jgi:hypothetical protein
MLYELSPVGLFNTALHSRDEAGLVFKHAVNRVSHQLFSILAIGRGHFLKPRFNSRREMYFHTLKSRNENSRCQALIRCPPSIAAVGLDARPYPKDRYWLQ